MLQNNLLRQESGAFLRGYQNSINDDTNILRNNDTYFNLTQHNEPEVSNGYNGYGNRNDKGSGLLNFSQQKNLPAMNSYFNEKPQVK